MTTRENLKRARLTLVSSAARAAVTTRRDRDEAIRAARRSGATFRELGEASGLSQGGVQSILERGT